jgi:hypothetical protein
MRTLPLLLLLRGGIAQGVPSTTTISDPLCVPHLSSNHSWFTDQSSLAATSRHLVAKQDKHGEKFAYKASLSYSAGMCALNFPNECKSSELWTGILHTVCCFQEITGYSNCHKNLVPYDYMSRKTSRTLKMLKEWNIFQSKFYVKLTRSLWETVIKVIASSVYSILKS